MPVKFRKVLIADERFESCGVFDVNADGNPDIVSGSYWYEGPDFVKRHKVGDIEVIEEYFDNFSEIPMDVNGDGHVDFITGAWWGQTLRWRENPGNGEGEWPEHDIAKVGPIERAQVWDVDGDGQLEIVPNTPGDPLKVHKLVTDANGKGTGKFTEHLIYDQPQNHGLGFGDINGDGRGDFILAKGWLEAPEDRYEGEWTLHADFDLSCASVPVLVVDVNGDGLNDIIVGQAHGYGLDWWEQGRDASGRRTWKKHPIDPFNAGYHDLRWVDLDGDGECELVTGKRYRAHCGNDPGEADDYGIYYFKWNGESFTKNIVIHGTPRETTGPGIFFQVADLRGSGRLDIVAPGKDGLYVFFNEGE